VRPDPSVGPTSSGALATELGLWQGRRGVLNTVICCALGALCSLGLWLFAERTTIVPACTQYAAANGWRYADFKLVGVKDASTVVCLLTREAGKTEDVHLDQLVPYFTNLLVEFAMTLEITVPGFAVLMAILRVSLDKSARRADA
jgi:hypothetical protein